MLDTAQAGDKEVGRSLGELQLATRAGVRIVGIERSGERIINPAATERLRPGDDLLVLGRAAPITYFGRP